MRSARQPVPDKSRVCLMSLCQSRISSTVANQSLGGTLPSSVSASAVIWSPSAESRVWDKHRQDRIVSALRAAAGPWTQRLAVDYDRQRSASSRRPSYLSFSICNKLGRSDPPWLNSHSLSKIRLPEDLWSLIAAHLPTHRPSPKG
jgi:hypothetical protein